MNTLAFLLGWRYIKSGRHQKNISTMIVVCFMGIFIGTFALALIASVMNGFEKATHEKLQGMHAQIIMRSTGNLLDVAKIEETLHQEFPTVIGVSPSDFQQVIVQPHDSRHHFTSGVIIKAVDPIREPTVSTIEKKIIPRDGKMLPLSTLLTKKSVILGTKLAATLGIKIGDTIDILYATDENIRNNKITLDGKNAIVAGFFSTGIEEFDSNLMITSFDFYHELFPELGVSQLSLKLSDTADENEIMSQLKKRFNLDIFSWKDLYPALVSALKLEKYVMFLILALVALVASMNSISLMFMQIIQKRADIALYHVMGMSAHKIRTIFMIMGMTLAVVAAILGVICATIVSYFLEHYPLITLPDTYYVSHLPARMEWYIIIGVLMLVLGMSLISIWYATRTIKTIHIAGILRSEG